MKTITRSQQAKSQKSLDNKQKQLKKQKPKKINDKKKLQKQQKQENKNKSEQQKKQHKKVQQKPQKTKPSPKKHLKKSYQASKKQRIYLINIRRVTAQQNPSLGNRWIFMVKSLSGANFMNHSVVFSCNQNYCTCKSFQIKKNTCIHIEFMIIQVIKNKQILEQIKKTGKLKQNEYKMLDEGFLDKLKARMQNQTYGEDSIQEKVDKNNRKQQKIDVKIDNDCSICYTQMDKLIQTLQQCTNCKKHFHYDCLTMWKKRNDTCPLCSANLKNFKNNIIDSLNNIDIQQRQINKKE